MFINTYAKYNIDHFINMLLIEFIKKHYGDKRGNKASFIRDNNHILPQELTRWLNAELKVNLKTGEIYKPTSKHINIKNDIDTEIHKLEPDTIIKLKAYAENNKMNSDQLINYLLEEDIARNQLLHDANDKTDNDTNSPVQLISKIINEHFATLSEHSETFEFQAVIEELMNDLLKKKLLNLKVPQNNIAESQRLKIPRIAYYWYGAIVAKRIAMMFGAYKVYLWNEILHPESEVIFLGTPNNVVACHLICDRVCKLFKKIKTNYKKTQGGWGNKKDIEDEANRYMYQFAEGIISFDTAIYDEDSQMRLIEYSSDKYSYTMS